ncbi:MAG: uroporphyrinogen decarboxylase family protein [Armatimonadota bacterium]
MTNRERLLAILNRQPTDKPCWTTLIDAKTRSEMPDQVRNMTHIDFYRFIGCSVLQLGPYGLEMQNQMPPPYRFNSQNMIEKYEHMSDGSIRIIREMDLGVLEVVYKDGHPTKYPVQTIDDIRLLKKIWLNSYYIIDTASVAAYYDLISDEIGDSGIYAETMQPSPVQQLIENEMGLETFYYMLQDYPSEMEELLEIMHSRRKEEYEIVSKYSSADVIIPIENTSSLMTSPVIFRKFSQRHLKDYAEIAHNSNKKIVVHMCGHLKDLLDDIAIIGVDGINGLTPPSVGNTTFEEALDVLGEHFIILGGIFPPEVIHNPNVSKYDIVKMLENIYTPRMRNANFLLWVATDGLPTGLEKFSIINEWFKSQ